MTPKRTNKAIQDLCPAIVQITRRLRRTCWGTNVAKRLCVKSIIFVFILAAPGRAGELSPEQTTAARKLYIGKCAKCHKLYDPARYTDPQWDRWMKRMSDKAKLKPNERELLARYIQESFRHSKASSGRATNGAVSLVGP